MSKPKIENKEKSKAPPGNPRWKKGGASPNPGGRPRNDVSLTAIAKNFIAMTSDEIANEIAGLRARYRKLGSGPATMGELIMAAFLWSLANDPQPGNMRELWRRIDGEVKDELSMTLKHEKIESYDYGDAIAAIAARPNADSPAPGESESDSDGAAVGQDADGG